MMPRDIAGYIRQEYHEIVKGGLPVLIRNIRNLCLKILAALFIPLVLIVRFLSPIVRIRFGLLESNRVGNLAATTELYLCRRDADIYDRETLDLFYYRGPISNRQLKKMWDRVLYTCPAVRLLDVANRYLPGYESHFVKMEEHTDRDGIIGESGPHISFTPREEEMGYDALRLMGVPKDAPFVCFHARDSAYLDKVRPDVDWRYLDFRNSDINNYLPAMEELVNRGYYAIRIGAVVKEPISTKNPKIIDYATRYRTDFLDVFLSAKCRFLIGSDSGPSMLPVLFRRPVIWLNFVALKHLHVCLPDHLFIPKKLRLRRENRFLTISEMVKSDVFDFYKTSLFEERGIELVNNTKDEITAVAIEMDERLKGIWHPRGDDEKLQERFWSILKSHDRYNRVDKILLRIGADFIRQNRGLLEREKSEETKEIRIS